MALLDQFVEDHDEKWHVDCYKIYRVRVLILSSSPIKQSGLKYPHPFDVVKNDM